MHLELVLSILISLLSSQKLYSLLDKVTVYLPCTFRVQNYRRSRTSANIHSCKYRNITSYRHICMRHILQTFKIKRILS